MLIVTIDLVPGGFDPLRRTIGSTRIANLFDLVDVSDYAIEAMEAANPLTGTAARNAECVVEGHDRRQCLWALLAKAAEEIMRAEFVEL
jgi:hypothetical protein